MKEETEVLSARGPRLKHELKHELKHVIPLVDSTHIINNRFNKKERRCICRQEEQAAQGRVVKDLEARLKAVEVDYGLRVAELEGDARKWSQEKLELEHVSCTRGFFRDQTFLLFFSLF